MRHPLVHRLAAIALGVAFLVASKSKIEEPRDFARIVYHYQVIGPNAQLGYVPANLLAVALPWTEAAAGVLLIAGLWRREAATVVAVLLVTFLVAVSWALYHGIDVETCGCFTVAGTGRRAGLGLLLSDLGLLAVAAFLAVGPGNREAARATAVAGALTVPASHE